MARYKVTGVAVFTSSEAGDVEIVVEADTEEDAADEAIDALERKERSGIITVEWAPGYSPAVELVEEEGGRR